MLHTSNYRYNGRIIRLSGFSFQSFYRRAFDIIVAAAGLIMLSPLIFIISLLIMIDSPGPIMCRLKRYTYSNIEFYLLEFRTRPVGKRELTTEHRADEIKCLTRVGRILLRSGMDKLPRLISVLCGEISIVGTHMFANPPGKLYPSLDPNAARPGLVTWTHSEDESEIPDGTVGIDRCVDYDRHYLEKRSFFFDMKLLCRALLSKSAYLQNQ